MLYLREILVCFSDAKISLLDGGAYIGLVDRLDRPNGLGKEYFPPPSANIIRYYGYYLNGKKHGNGTLYNINGKVDYYGEFLDGKPLKRTKNKSNNSILKESSANNSLSQNHKGKGLSIGNLPRKV